MKRNRAYQSGAHKRKIKKKQTEENVKSSKKFSLWLNRSNDETRNQMTENEEFIVKGK